MSAAQQQQKRPIRVLVCKLGLDGHDRGALVICRAFRDAGMEVIYSGLFCTPEQIANMAIDEDADVVAMSLLNGAHLTLFPKVARLLKEKGGGDILVVGGGIIPESDRNEGRAPIQLRRGSPRVQTLRELTPAHPLVTTDRHHRATCLQVVGTNHPWVI